MKTVLSFGALLLLVLAAQAAVNLTPEDKEKRLAELANAQKAAQARAHFDRQTRFPRLTKALDDIINDRVETQTMTDGGPADPAGQTSEQTVVTLKSKAKVYMQTHRPSTNLQASSSITLGPDPDYFVELENQMEPLEEDYKQILENFKKIGCFDNSLNPLGIENLILDPVNGKMKNNTRERNPYSLCDGDLADELFLPLGDTTKHGTEVFDHFNEHVYQPLSYKVYPNRFAFADALQDMLNLDKDNLMIKADLPIPDLKTFKEMILGGFAEISNYAMDFDANKPVIAKLIMDILKHFHIYWNVKRQKNEIDSTKVNTYSILNEIIKQYRSQNAAMKATTIQILHAIRDAYFRFLKAHKMLNFIQMNTQDILGYNLLKRYDNFIQTILGGGYFQFFYIFELSCIIEIMTTYIFIDVTTGSTDADAYGHFYNNVYRKVLAMYNVYAKWLIDTQSEYFDLVTEVTATIALKMQHRGAVLVSLTSMLGFTQAASFVYKSREHSTVTTYFELMDYWMLIPEWCKNYVDLQTCAVGNGNDFLWRVRQTNRLQYSMTGMNLWIFLKNSFQQMIDAVAARNGFSNFETFKNLYYAELFRTSENIRTVYKVNDMTILDRLQNKLGQVVEKKKADQDLNPELLKVLGRLDDAMYNFFLHLKEEFNTAGDIRKDMHLLNLVAERTDDFLEDFQGSNFECKDGLINGIFPLLSSLTKGWVEFMTKQNSSLLVDSEAETPGNEITPLPVKDSVIIQNVVREPQIDSAASSPVFFTEKSLPGRKVVR